MSILTQTEPIVKNITSQIIYYNHRISETNFLRGKLMDSNYKRIIISGTNSGKTHYVINEAKEQCQKFIFVVDTIALGKQLSKKFGLPFHYSGNKVDPNTPQVITLYNWLGYFYNEDNLDRLLIIDEIHTLVTARKYRKDHIIDFIEEMSYYDRIIGLTGTFIKSKWFDDFFIDNCQSDKPKVEATVVRFNDDVQKVAGLTKQAIDDGKQVFIYLQSKDPKGKFGRLVSLLNDHGITSIKGLNSVTVKEEENLEGVTEILETELFSSQVLISTYSQGYSINNANVVYICFPEVSYIDIAQSIARLRNLPHKAYILSNAWLESSLFESAYDDAYRAIVNQCRLEQKEAKVKAKSQRHFQRFMEKKSTGKYFLNLETIDDNLIALDTVETLTDNMQKDLGLLKSALDHYGVNIGSVERLSTPLIREEETNQDLETEDPNKLVSLMFQYLGNGLSMPAKLFSVYKDFQELQQYLDLVQATEFMLETWHTLTPQEFSKFITTEQFKNPDTVEKKLFKKLVLEEFQVGNIYEPEVLRQTVRDLADQSGLKVNPTKEKNLLECLVTVKRANKANHLKITSHLN